MTQNLQRQITLEKTMILTLYFFVLRKVFPDLFRFTFSATTVTFLQSMLQQRLSRIFREKVETLQSHKKAELRNFSDKKKLLPRTS